MSDIDHPWIPPEPCIGCGWRKECSTYVLACEDFVAYVEIGDIIPAEHLRVPTKKLYEIAHKCKHCRKFPCECVL